MRGGGSGFVRSMIWTIVLGVLGLGVFVWSLVFVASGTVTRQVRARWEADSVTRESLLERFPTEGANASALETERLALRLGLAIAPRSSDQWEVVPPARRQPFRAVKGPLGGWVDAQVRRDHREIDAPPDEVARYLAANEAEIAALCDHLASAEEPRWEQDVDGMFQTPVPNLLALLDLQRVLHAATLARARAGDREGALLAIEASWRLGGSLHSRPTLVSQLIAISMTRDQVGILRQLDGLPPIWRARLHGLGMRRSLVDALRFESWIWAYADSSRLDGQTSLLTRAAGAVAAPYVGYCFAEASDRMRVRANRLAELPFLCDANLDARGVSSDLRLPPWNALGYVAAQDLKGTVERVALLEVDVELTAKILELDAARRDGRWPRAVPGIEKSEACPHDRWLYEVDEDGPTISFARALRWRESNDRPLPTRFRLGS